MRIDSTLECIMEAVMLADRYGVQPQLNGYKVQLDSHSTADHLWIYAVMGDEELLVFYKTNWHGDYAFNDMGKIIGFQNDKAWYVPTLQKYFDECADNVKAYLAERDAEKEQKGKEEKQAELDKFSRFEKAFAVTETPTLKSEGVK